MNEELSILDRMLKEITPQQERETIYHLLLMDYIRNLYPELEVLCEEIEIGYRLVHVPFYEANSDFKLIECLNWGIKMNYDLK